MKKINSLLWITPLNKFISLFTNSRFWLFFRKKKYNFYSAIERWVFAQRKKPDDFWLKPVVWTKEGYRAGRMRLILWLMMDFFPRHKKRWVYVQSQNKRKWQRREIDVELLMKERAKRSEQAELYLEAWDAAEDAASDLAQKQNLPEDFYYFDSLAEGEGDLDFKPTFIKRFNFSEKDFENEEIYYYFNKYRLTIENRWLRKLENKETTYNRRHVPNQPRRGYGDRGDDHMPTLRRLMHDKAFYEWNYTVYRRMIRAHWWFSRWYYRFKRWKQRLQVPKMTQLPNYEFHLRHDWYKYAERAEKRKERRFRWRFLYKLAYVVFRSVKTFMFVFKPIIVFLKWTVGYPILAVIMLIWKPLYIVYNVFAFFRYLAYRRIFGAAISNPDVFNTAQYAALWFFPHGVVYFSQLPVLVADTLRGWGRYLLFSQRQLLLKIFAPIVIPLLALFWINHGIHMLIRLMISRGYPIWRFIKYKIKHSFIIQSLAIISRIIFRLAYVIVAIAPIVLEFYLGPQQFVMFMWETYYAMMEFVLGPDYAPPVNLRKDWPYFSILSFNFFYIMLLSAPVAYISVMRVPKRVWLKDYKSTLGYDKNLYDSRLLARAHLDHRAAATIAGFIWWYWNLVWSFWDWSREIPSQIWVTHNEYIMGICEDIEMMYGWYDDLRMFRIVNQPPNGWAASDNGFSAWVPPYITIYYLEPEDFPTHVTEDSAFYEFRWDWVEPYKPVVEHATARVPLEYMDFSTAYWYEREIFYLRGRFIRRLRPFYHIMYDNQWNPEPGRNLYDWSDFLKKTGPLWYERVWFPTALFGQSSTYWWEYKQEFRTVSSDAPYGIRYGEFWNTLWEDNIDIYLDRIVTEWFWPVFWPHPMMPDYRQDIDIFHDMVIPLAPYFFLGYLAWTHMHRFYQPGSWYRRWGLFGFLVTVDYLEMVLSWYLLSKKFEYFLESIVTKYDKGPDAPWYAGKPKKQVHPVPLWYTTDVEKWLLGVIKRDIWRRKALGWGEEHGHVFLSVNTYSANPHWMWLSIEDNFWVKEENHDRPWLVMLFYPEPTEKSFLYDQWSASEIEPRFATNISPWLMELHDKFEFLNSWGLTELYTHFARYGRLYADAVDLPDSLKTLTPDRPAFKMGTWEGAPYRPMAMGIDYANAKYERVFYEYQERQEISARLNYAFRIKPYYIKKQAWLDPLATPKEVLNQHTRYRARWMVNPALRDYPLFERPEAAPEINNNLSSYYAIKCYKTPKRLGKFRMPVKHNSHFLRAQFWTVHDSRLWYEEGWQAKTVEYRHHKWVQRRRRHFYYLDPEAPYARLTTNYNKYLRELWAQEKADARINEQDD